MGYVKNFNSKSKIAGPAPFTTLTEGMNVELVANKDGRFWVLHDKPFPHILKWMEFDADASSLIFVSQDGDTLELGMKVQPYVAQNVRKASRGYVIHKENGRMQDLYIVPLITSTAGEVSGRG